MGIWGCIGVCQLALSRDLVVKRGESWLCPAVWCGVSMSCGRVRLSEERRGNSGSSAKVEDVDELLGFPLKNPFPVVLISCFLFSTEFQALKRLY